MEEGMNERKKERKKEKTKSKTNLCFRPVKKEGNNTQQKCRKHHCPNHSFDKIIKQAENMLFVIQRLANFFRRRRRRIKQPMEKIENRLLRQKKKITVTYFYSFLVTY
jgi:hypothetical protein